ncbi:MAG TPA: NAD-dependent epimerase/dehydratase family protein [Candidatus Polarisedimenticolia bacterium]|nr:NAD-dependent epimerase/dehydratase family protein [Candidatus Polarisedimenticolia bacterium]
MKPVVVLGGTGFLGRRVMRLLEERGLSARSLSRREGCDLTEARALAARLRELQPRAVINCAAHVGSVHYVGRRAADVIHDNMLMIAHTYAAIRQSCPGALLVNPISNCSYPGESLAQRESAWQEGPVHDSVLAFASTRRMVHAFARSYMAQHGIASANWLIPNAYGPGDGTDPDRVHALDGILIRLIQAQRRGDRTVPIWGSGRPVREWVYVDDVAAVLVRSLDRGAQLDPINVAQNRGHSIAEIGALAAKLLGYDVGFEFDTSYADGAPRKIMDDALFRRACPDFRFTPLDEGIRATIEYYRSIL